MSDHTPGPWRLEERTGFLYAGERGVIAEVLVVEHPDAHLIAAAPDLLAEAEGLLTALLAVRDMLDAPSDAAATVAGLEAVVPAAERLNDPTYTPAISKAKAEVTVDE